MTIVTVCTVPENLQSGLRIMFQDYITGLEKWRVTFGVRVRVREV